MNYQMPTNPTVDEIRDRLAAGTARLRINLPGEAYYAAAVRTSRPSEEVHEISVGVDALHDGLGDGCLGEWRLVWVDLGYTTPSLHLRAFDDAWHALIAANFLTLLAKLTPRDYGESPSYEDVKAALIDAGYVDTTTRTNPYA